MRAVLAVLLLLAGGLPQDDVVRKVVSDADKIKKLTRKISKESRDKIEKALGEQRAAAGGDEAAKDLDTLLKVNSQMRAVGPMWDRLLAGIDKKDKSAADEIAAMDKAFEESMKAAAGSKVLSAAKQEKFKTAAADSR